MDNAMKKIDYKFFLQNERNYFLLYIFVFSAYCAYNLLRWPIGTGDTDLWYHLNGGRYFFKHYSIPHDSFFSFIVPAHIILSRCLLYCVFRGEDEQEKRSPVFLSVRGQDAVARG
jgi:hypothetical protein